MDETAADPTNVRAGSGSEGEEVGEEAAGTEGRAPQGYQQLLTVSRNQPCALGPK